MLGVPRVIISKERAIGTEPAHSTDFLHVTDLSIDLVSVITLVALHLRIALLLTLMLRALHLSILLFVAVLIRRFSHCLVLLLDVVASKVFATRLKNLLRVGTLTPTAS